MPPPIKMHINSLAGGSLKDKELEEAHEKDKAITKKQPGVYELEFFNALAAQIALLNKINTIALDEQIIKKKKESFRKHSL